MAAPAETRTPNLQRAKCSQRLRTEGWRQWRLGGKKSLDSDRPSHGRRYHVRLQRELKMRRRKQPSWIAYSDWLILFSILVCIIFVFIPLFLLPKQLAITFAHAGCFAAIILLAGFVPSILAHYRLGFGGSRTGPRDIQSRKSAECYRRERAARST